MKEPLSTRQVALGLVGVPLLVGLANLTIIQSAQRQTLNALVQFAGLGLAFFSKDPTTQMIGAGMVIGGGSELRGDGMVASLVSGSLGAPNDVLAQQPITYTGSPYSAANLPNPYKGLTPFQRRYAQQGMPIGSV